MTLRASLLLTLAISTASVAAPPNARVETITEDQYGTRVSDDYRWMESGKDPEWMPWLKAQAAHTDEVLAKIPGRAALLADIGRATGELAVIRSAQRAGTWLFHEQRPVGAQDMQLMVRGEDGKDRVLFKPEDGERALVLDWWDPSPDGRYVAVGLSTRGTEISTAQVIEVSSGRMLPDRIAQVGRVSWLPDSSGFSYLRFAGQAGTPSYYVNSEARLHRLGATGTDPFLFKRGEPGVEVLPTQMAGVFLDPSSETALLGVFDGRPDRRLYAAPLADVLASQPRWTKVADFEDQINSVALIGDDLYLLTSRDAPRRKLLRLSASKPDLSRAELIIPETDVLIEEVVPAESGPLLRTLEGGVAGLRQVRGNEAVPVKLPFAGSINQLNSSSKSDEAFVQLAGWFSPGAVWRLEGGVLTNAGLVPPPAVSTLGYEERRGLATARDGTKIPYTILSRRGVEANGANPTLMEAYGAYGISYTPVFRPHLLPFLDRGGVFVLANVRGGGEFGRSWHEAGRAANKANTWNDAIAVAETLVQDKLTSPANLALIGTSAGGIMVGNALNDRPDLFAAGIANVGFMNPTRYVSEQNFADIEEWGGPIRDAGSYRIMADMDPTLRIRPKAGYPATLVVSGINDPRAATFHSAKYAARLQAASSSGEPVLLRIDFDAGHGFNSGRSQNDRTWADIYSFVLWQTGAKEFQPQARRGSSSD